MVDKRSYAQVLKDAADNLNGMTSQEDNGDAAVIPVPRLRLGGCVMVVQDQFRLQISLL